VIETEILTLDRIAIEEAGPNPDNLAAAIHAQLKRKSGAVPVPAIAQALDIVDIRQERLHSIEGGLVMTPDRTSPLHDRPRTRSPRSCARPSGQQARFRQ
jgi:hypothetical protein